MWNLVEALKDAITKHRVVGKVSTTPMTNFPPASLCKSSLNSSSFPSPSSLASSSSTSAITATETTEIASSTTTATGGFGSGSDSSGSRIITRMSSPTMDQLITDGKLVFVHGVKESLSLVCDIYSHKERLLIERYIFSFSTHQCLDRTFGCEGDLLILLDGNWMDHWSKYLSLLPYGNILKSKRFSVDELVLRCYLRSNGSSQDDDESGLSSSSCSSNSDEYAFSKYAELKNCKFVSGNENCQLNIIYDASLDVHGSLRSQRRFSNSSPMPSDLQHSKVMSSSNNRFFKKQQSSLRQNASSSSSAVTAINTDNNLNGGGSPILTMGFSASSPAGNSVPSTSTRSSLLLSSASNCSSPILSNASSPSLLSLSLQKQQINLPPVHIEEHHILPLSLSLAATKVQEEKEEVEQEEEAGSNFETHSSKPFEPYSYGTSPFVSSPLVEYDDCEEEDVMDQVEDEDVVMVDGSVRNVKKRSTVDAILITHSSPRKDSIAVVHSLGTSVSSSYSGSRFSRRNSLQMTTKSLVGSYEESLLSGRMSTAPSKPIQFIAQIGVHENSSSSSDGKDPKQQRRHGAFHSHAFITFPAHFYDIPNEETPSPYVGDVDLEGQLKQGKIQGVYRLPLQGRLQIMIKNLNKSLVKLFLIPYDYRDMPNNTRTFLRMKQVASNATPADDREGNSTSASRQPVPSFLASSDSSLVQQHASASNLLRSVIHCHFIKNGKGQLFLFKSIRAVFTNRSMGDEPLESWIERPDALLMYTPISEPVYTVIERMIMRKLLSSTSNSSSSRRKDQTTDEASTTADAIKKEATMVDAIMTEPGEREEEEEDDSGSSHQRSIKKSRSWPTGFITLIETGNVKTTGCAAPDSGISPTSTGTSLGLMFLDTNGEEARDGAVGESVASQEGGFRGGGCK